MNLIEIDKITAARNLFNDATLLFYEKRSAVSIHHLAHAAHEVLSAITGDRRMFEFLAPTPQAEKEFRRLFNASKNFIKHADKDPQSTITLNIETNILILLDCAWIIVLNIDKECVYSQTVISWCSYAYPDLFDDEHINLISTITPRVDLLNFEPIVADLKLHYLQLQTAKFL